MTYVPSAWQREFHQSTVDELLGGGCAGPGKSLALLMDANDQIVVEHERWRNGEIDRSVGWALHVRKEYPRLEANIDRSKTLFPQLDPGAVYDAAAHKWRFSSGYQYSFGHVANAESFRTYRSNDYTALYFDELTEIPDKNTYDELVLRVRTVDPVLRTMLRVKSVTNPGAGWVRDLFVAPAPEGRKIIRKRIRLDDGTWGERTRMFLPAKLADNPSADFRRQYELSLRDRPPHIQASLLHGNWWVVAGAYFADLFDPSRVVIKPFKIPSGWKRFRSGDWGYKQPCVILWWAVTPEGGLICYREFACNGPKAKRRLDAVGVAEQIRDIEISNGEWNRMRDCSRLTGPMDTNLWQEVGHRGPTMAHDMARLGVFWTKASKGRRMCTQQLVRRLTERGYDDRAGIQFFDTCQGCITTIPAIPTDPTDPEVPEKGGPDHHLDACFYAVSANPLPSGKEDARRDEDDDDQAPTPVNRGRYGYG